jgi:isoleucyl-tRNA synthetase
VADEKAVDSELMTDMDLIIKVCSLGRSARNKSGIKLRQPLSTAKVFADKVSLKRIRKFEDVIVNELNVKKVSFATQKDKIVEYSVNPLPQALGKKYGKLYPKIKEAITKLNAKTTAHALSERKSVRLKVEGKTIEILPEEAEVTTGPKHGYSLSEEEGLAVAVDVTIQMDLKEEGLARDIVRRIQNQRKEAGFNIADLIETYYEAGPKLSKVFENYEEYIAAETLTATLREGNPPKEAHKATYKIEGESLTMGLKKVKKVV